MNYYWYDAVGNVGVLLVLACYFLIQAGRLDIRALPYSVLNGVGAILIMVSLFYSFNLSSFVIECAWLAISVYGVARRVLELRRGS